MSDDEHLETPPDAGLDNDQERERIDIDALLASCGRLHQGFDPYAIGKSLGMSDQAIKMGVGLLNGMTAVAALKAAGYTGDPKSNVFRSKASKAARTKQMLRFLQTAKEFKPNSKPLGAQEKLSILAELSRIKNPGIQTRAILAHSQLEAELGEQAEGEDNYWDRPDKYIAAALAVIPEPFGLLAASVFALYPGPRDKVGKGTSFFYIQPLGEALAPHLAKEFPDVWQRLLRNCKNDWERQCLSEDAAKPPKPIAEIIAAVDANDGGKSVRKIVDELMADRPLPPVLLSNAG